MNSEKIQRLEEHKCASIEERILAAKKLLTPSPSPLPLKGGEDIRQRTDPPSLWRKGEGVGYRVGFHFDPLIDYAGWEEDYEIVIGKIFDRIPENRIAWISLGCLRFMPELKPIMQDRFPHSELTQAEWIRGMDGKLRYFKPRRVEIYRRMVEMIRRQAPRVTLYLSMESPEVWRLVFGGQPSRESVCQMLDRSASLSS